MSRVDIIIGKLKPSNNDGNKKLERKPDPMMSSDFAQDVEGDEDDLAEEAAAEELLAAIKAGDAKAVVEALKTWHEICYGSEDESEDDDSMADMMKKDY